jgi:hypothetical protein
LTRYAADLMAVLGKLVARFFDLYWPTVAELAAIVEEISRFSEELATI